MAAPVKLRVFAYDALPSSAPVESSVGVPPRSSFNDIENLACQQSSSVLDELRACPLDARSRSFSVQIQILNLLPESLPSLASRQRCEVSSSFEPSDWSVFTLIVREKWVREYDRKSFVSLLSDVSKRFELPEKLLAHAIGISQSRLSQLKNVSREASSAVYQSLGRKLEEYSEELTETLRVVGSIQHERERLLQVVRGRGQGVPDMHDEFSSSAVVVLPADEDDDVEVTSHADTPLGAVGAKRALSTTAATSAAARRPKKPYGPRITYTDAEVQFIDKFVHEVIAREKGARHLSAAESELILTTLNDSEERKKIVADGGPAITAGRLATFVNNRKQKLAAEAAVAASGEDGAGGADLEGFAHDAASSEFTI